MNDNRAHVAGEATSETLDRIARTSEPSADRTPGLAGDEALLKGSPQLGQVEPNAELVLYRVAQESLTNVARHSNATQVLLDLRRNSDSVVLRIADNGQGFEQPHREGGGLRSIRENALIVGGALAIKRSSTGGVEVRLEVPSPNSR
jgi:two-component system sensor histidine kinase UhpB